MHLKIYKEGSSKKKKYREDIIKKIKEVPTEMDFIYQDLKYYLESKIILKIYIYKQMFFEL